MTVSTYRDERVWEFTYWVFQTAAWGAYVIAGLAMILPQTGPQPSVVGGYVLFFFYSIALTHAMRRVVHRRDWLSLAPGPAAIRLLGAALLVSSVQISLIVLVSWLWNGTAPTATAWPYYLSMIASVAAGTLLWTACYTGAAALLRARRARQNAVQLELAMREARLKALEAQIGPHFLFNCLNTLRGLIIENPIAAQDIVTRLA
ncbi:MAG TPA: histidine kinase, partial [Candidatus Synoicihabitans sp.]|nr:histidine kinase [Candidatus Synoicihabitans sp.]